jgi:enoyl-CoA hydratase
VGEMSQPPEGGEETEPVLRERHGATLLLRLNRPQRLNAVSGPLYEALMEGLSEAESDSEVRVVVVTGTGRAFCVGADLKSHASAEPTREELRRYVRLAQRANLRLQRSRLPVVAAVNGHAVGAGLELALSADLIVMAEEAKLRLPEAALATFVGGGVTRTLPDRVGMARAREILLMADFFTPRDALEMGLVNRVTPSAEVLPTALEWGERLASRSPRSLRLLKQLLDGAHAAPPARIFSREARALLSCMGTDDWREGIRAFEEHRPPTFRER